MAIPAHSSGRGMSIRNGGSIVFLHGAEEGFAGHATFSESIRKLREGRSLDDGSARAPCFLDHLFRGPLAHAAFEPLASSTYQA